MNKYNDVHYSKKSDREVIDYLFAFKLILTFHDNVKLSCAFGAVSFLSFYKFYTYSVNTILPVFIRLALKEIAQNELP